MPDSAKLPSDDPAKGPSDRAFFVVKLKWHLLKQNQHPRLFWMIPRLYIEYIGSIDIR